MLLFRNGNNFKHYKNMRSTNLSNSNNTHWKTNMVHFWQKFRFYLELLNTEEEQYWRSHYNCYGTIDANMWRRMPQKKYLIMSKTGQKHKKLYQIISGRGNTWRFFYLARWVFWWILLLILKLDLNIDRTDKHIFYKE